MKTSQPPQVSISGRILIEGQIPASGASPENTPPSPSPPWWETLTARATFMLALGTVALAIVSLVALLVTHADARGLIKQTRIASKQQHDDNKELVVSANRAWTAPFKAEIIHVLWNQEALAFDVWVENTRREPALNFAGQEDKKARKIVPMPQSNDIWDKIFDEFPLNVTFARVLLSTEI
ncbi:MAG TPA: hypothetical protein VFL62_19950 [Bradyrhizobium sp.]|uniref:hypothetical protein n=1 Tax=Bradyrhizobium sp. TaxID=376 RepID=UPI002D80D47F|nr:hypothetical protein [Bradyrhizobium sp.]HET7888503.1 hypothetical protein [Bradyrhizobium sp.]